jgi:aminomethyltransferase
MLNENGGVIDDLIIYQLSQNFYRVVINAGTREKDLIWMEKQALTFNVQLQERDDLAMLAIQGPTVKEKIKTGALFSGAEEILNLKSFTFKMVEDTLIAKTGYTGEEGYEVIFPVTLAEKYWHLFLENGILPCGLGARDTLRLEAGLNLYGSDMDESVTPLESNLGWTVAMEPTQRDFCGRKALEKQFQQGVSQRLVGLVLEGPGIIRNHQKVFIHQDGEGEVTSGGYSPTLAKSIALARIPAKANESCFVEIRQKQIPARIVKPPFVRHGKNLIS